MLPYLLLSLELLTMRQAPVGTQLHIRLTTAVGSYASKAGTPVQAVLIAPVIVGGETYLPEGSILSGTVNSVQRVGLGIFHETAALHLEFRDVALPDGRSFPISVRVEQVDNGRERVHRDGSIRGVRATGSLSYRVSGYVRTALSWQVPAGLGFWAIQTLLVQVPESEIYYPTGVELTLALTGPLSTARAESREQMRPLTDEERADLEPVVAAMSHRTYAPTTNRPADLINMLFIGSRDQLAAAFVAAGWTEAQPVSFRFRMRGIQAVAEGRAFLGAPMSPLLLDRTEADMSWQKGLNDFAKRHHIRVWKQSRTGSGQEVWIGAGTRDIDFAFLRRGQALSHRIQEDVDQERDKIANDLVFTSCVDVADWWERPDMSRVARNATGDPMNTDTRLAVIRFNDCPTPRLSTQTGDLTPLRAHGNGLERIIRRQILSAKSDLLRANIYWRGYEGTRWMIAAIRRRRQSPSDSAGLERSAKLSWSPFSRDRAGSLW